jgi:hypothetical protein
MANPSRAVDCISDGDALLVAEDSGPVDRASDKHAGLHWSRETGNLT